MNARIRNKLVKIKKIVQAPFLHNPITKNRVAKFHNYMRQRLRITEPPTIICSNCIGGIISHNLGLRFMSPTINLTINNRDFIKFITDLDHYLNCELTSNPERAVEVDCPVGMLEDVEIVFTHYKTFDEAKEKWEERKKRINPDNLYIMMSLGAKEMERFDIINEIKCKRKVVFTPFELPQYDFVFPMKQYEGQIYVGQSAGFGFDGFRAFEKEFDYVAWLNGEENLRTQYFKKHGRVK